LEGFTPIQVVPDALPDERGDHDVGEDLPFPSAFLGLAVAPLNDLIRRLEAGDLVRCAVPVGLNPPILALGGRRLLRHEAFLSDADCQARSAICSQTIMQNNQKRLDARTTNPCWHRQPNRGTPSAG